MTSKLWEFYAIQLREAFSVLLDEASRGFDSITLTRTLRCLLVEGISIRDLRTILEATLAIESTSTADFCKFIIFEPNTGFHFPARDSRSMNDLDGEDFAECARIALRSYISHKYTQGSANLVVYLLDPDIEARLTRIEKEPLTQPEYEGMVAAIRQEVGLQPSTVQTPTILTTILVRRFLRRLIETDFPWLPVLSYQELSPNTNIQPIARIRFDFQSSHKFTIV
jgi:type III secretory pathway component EscV